MKQLEVISFPISQRNCATYNPELLHSYKLNIWLMHAIYLVFVFPLWELEPEYPEKTDELADIYVSNVRGKNVFKSRKKRLVLYRKFKKSRNFDF